MRVLVIKSRNAEHVLAEIRTDNRQVDFTVDNTGGRLPKMIGRSYERLMNVLRNSSTLYADTPTTATAQLLRYVLDNGDVAEITTDGKTALLNGKLLDEQEKNVLFMSIRSGQIKVARKADMSAPIPVLPPVTKLKQAPVSTGIDDGLLSEFKKMANDQEEKDSMSSEQYDYHIENADLSDAEDPDYVKHMLYSLKYGASRDRK